MFGYVNISCETIKEEDKKLYSAYYCGLCKAISKKSQLSRLGLSNDLTFLSVLLAGVYEENPEFLENSRCIMHGFKNHDEIKVNPVTEYTSDMNILLVYFKICDDVSDEQKLSKKGLKLICKKTAEKIKRRYPQISSEIIENLSKLSELEKKECKILDEVADCFGKLLQSVFVPDFIKDEGTKKVLSWMGYNLGRWIYIADAYEDMEKDIKNKNYNPLVFYKGENLKQDIYDSMTYSLANIASAYDLLDIKRNDTLIRNILYAGLPQKQESIFNKTEEDNGSL